MIAPVFDLWAMAIAFLGGIALGGVSLAALAWNVGLYTAAENGLLNAVGLHVARLVVVGAAFWVVSSLGALPLIASLGGYLVARTIATRLVKRAV